MREKMRKKCKPGKGDAGQMSNKCRKNAEHAISKSENVEKWKKCKHMDHKGGGRRMRPPPLWGGQKPPSMYLNVCNCFLHFLTLKLHAPHFLAFI